jgi:hypothetical protein
MGRERHRRLRLTTMIVNPGKGPFEIRATRPSTSETTMTIRQRILRADGTWGSLPTDAAARYAGDGHDHWHVMRVTDMRVLRPDGKALRGSKVAFCFFDTTHTRPDLPTSPDQVVYRESRCGTKASLGINMGISVGWGDKYQWSLAYQCIDITGLAAGTYPPSSGRPRQTFPRDARMTTVCGQGPHQQLEHRLGHARGSGCTPPRGPAHVRERVPRRATPSLTRTPPTCSRVPPSF